MARGKLKAEIISINHFRLPHAFINPLSPNIHIQILQTDR